jgi:hypothetical protein
VPKSGAFARGLAVEAIAFGAFEAFSGGAQVSGVIFSAGLQFDLGPQLALRVPVHLAAGGDRRSAQTGRFYGEIDVAPGILYRLRYDGTQSWVAYAGTGIKVGFFDGGRGFLGLDLRPDSGQFSDPNHVTEGSLGVEALVGVDYQPTLWLAVDLAVSDSLLWIGGVAVDALAETVGLRVMF